MCGMPVDDCAYCTAKHAVETGMATMCVPGLMAGEPVVSTQAFAIDDDSKEWLFSVDPHDRVRFICSVAIAAHNIAGQGGVLC